MEDGRTEYIHVEIDADLKALIRCAAAFNDQSMSSWVRENLLAAAEEDLPAGEWPHQQDQSSAP